MIHLVGCPREADPRNETCDCETRRSDIANFEADRVEVNLGQPLSDAAFAPLLKPALRFTLTVDITPEPLTTYGELAAALLHTRKALPRLR